MNERIRELSAIAKNLTTYDAIHLSRIHNRTLSLDELGEIFEQKFAKLIVEECAIWMENATVTDSSGNKDYIGDSFFWSSELKKHFGVEE